MSRKSASLFRSALSGALLSTVVLASGAMNVGCRDENDPMTYVAELSDPVQQTVAIKRLLQFYEDAMTKDKKDRNGPTVKPLLDKIVEPLAKVCLDTGVKDRTRSSLVKFLSDVRDPRGDECLKKTLSDYKPDSTEEDVQHVVRSIAQTKSKAFSAELIKVYETLEVSRPKARNIYKDVFNAILATTDKSQEDYFIKRLAAPVDPQKKQEADNQNFWQQTAARALGEMKSEKAPKELLRVIISPTKGPIATTALVSMVQIGKASIAPTEALLKGEDAELVKYSVEEQLKLVEKDKDGKIPEAAKKTAEKAHLQIAAQVLGSLGAEGSIAPLLTTAEKSDDPATKVVISLYLPQLPRNEAATALFRKTYEESKLDLEVAQQGARELLASTASDFFDASMASWLVKTSADLKGESSEIDPIRSIAIVSATKVMKADQVAEVETLFNTKAYLEEDNNKKKETTVGKAFETEFNQAKALLAKCNDGLDCYFSALSADENQDKAKQFTAIKAAYMIGILGGEKDRAKLVELLPKLSNDSVRLTALKALEVLTPKGDKETADKLEALFAKAEEAKDDALIADYRLFVQTAARLRARGQ